MSVTLLPEWKQLLLERKRREEEERGRREKEEEEKFANMPAWKRGIIQRRKAKQDVFESKVANQVSLETIVPVHENPFIRTQCVWRKGRDGEGGNELEVKEREKWTPRIQDGDMDRGHDVEQKLDRGSHLAHSVLSQHTEELINKIEQIRDTTVHSNDKEQGSKASHCIQTGETAPTGLLQGSLEVQIPRTVFYVAKELSDKKKSGQNLEEGGEVERRDSWRVGKPLSRIESLREKIRQRELEKQQRIATQDGNGMAAADAACDKLNEERRTEVEEEGEATGHMQQRPIKAETEEEDVAAQTSTSFFDTVQEKQEMPEMSHKSSRQQVCSPTSHSKQTFSVTPSFVRSRSPDNFLRATDCAPTPASSPCSPSPSQSPNISPSPSPSPTLFSIRSASGGPVKRGATITITPKKTVLGAAMGHTVRPMAAELTSTNTKSLQNHISTTAAEESKKKYPTVEEIEVIGGYENLERSCLIKKGGTPKRVSKDNKPEKTFFIQCYSLGTKNTQK
uniref:Phostensin n=1 Tax=Gouania willdenowi TaxID=441366 RepID=A0A8C5N2S8_GOUWI